MTEPQTRLPGRTRGTGTTHMVVGTLVAAVAAYLFQLVAGRALGPTEFAPITVLWTVQFLVFTTVFIPMEQLTIRRLNLDTTHAAPWRLFLVVIGVSMAGAVAFTALTLDRLFDGEALYLLTVAALIAAYGWFALGRGFLAGRRRFREYGLSTFAESVLRLVLAIGLLAAGVGALGLGWTLVAGALVVFLWRPFRGEREREAGAAREQGTGAALATFISANAASQTIVAAGPLVVGALGAPAAEVSVFFETFLLFRAPLTVAYNLVSRVLPPFTRFVERGALHVVRRWAVRLAAAAAVTAALGYVVGRAVGPALVEFLLGDEFRPGAALAAVAASGVVLATVALFVQQMLIAMRATTRLAVAWIAGLVAAAVMIALTDGSASLRVGRAFLTGEIVAFAGLVVGVLTIRRRDPGRD
jgi:O-antigen/teichoic acid export membrane protein